jgi:hypothetical protein
MCRRCGLRPVLPARLRARNHRCSRCVNSTPEALARIKRYRESAKGKATAKASNNRKNPRRIYIGERYHSVADTMERAHRINAHIKDRIACRSVAILDKNEN